jgi:hypothetical protein
MSIWERELKRVAKVLSEILSSVSNKQKTAFQILVYNIDQIRWLFNESEKLFSAYIWNRRVYYFIDYLDRKVAQCVWFRSNMLRGLNYNN